MAKNKLATPEARSNSSYQNRINSINKRYKQLLGIMNWRTKVYRQHQKFVEYLLENNRTSKEELSRFFFKIEK